MKTLLLFLSAFIICAATNAQIITTIAGTSIAGNTGDGGPATAARINKPYGFAMDRAGNIYFSDETSSRIRKIDVSGIITTIAGTGAQTYGGDGGLAIYASFNYPEGIAIDTSGNIYVADHYDNRIRKIDNSGIITTFAMANGPTNVATDASGNVYISEAYRILKADAAGTITVFAGGGSGSADGVPATNISIAPHGLKADAAGNIYVVDIGGGRIYKINTSGIINKIAGTGLWGYSGDGGPATAAQLDAPLSIELDAIGNIYIGDGNDRYIRKVTPAGIISTFSGQGPGYLWFNGDNIPVINAEAFFVEAICYAPNGVLYWTDYGGHRIRKITNLHPRFIRSHHQIVQNCGPGIISLDSSLAILDSDIIQQETWSLLVPPLHGSIPSPYSTAATGGTLLPSGITYTPFIGYIGEDSFSVVISDGWFTDTATIVISNYPINPSVSVSGPAQLCTGDTATLLPTPSYGVWHSNSSVVSVAPNGHITALAAGIANIIYKVSNVCATDSAIQTISVGTPVAAFVSITSSADSICAGTPLTLTASAINAGTSPMYRWFKNGALMGTSGTGYSSSAFINGDVIHCDMVSSIFCASPDTAHSNSKTLRVFNAIYPALSLTYNPMVICEGSPATVLPVPVRGGPSPVYRWFVDGVLSSVLSPFSYTPANGDIVTCTMRSNDTSVCSVADTISAATILHTTPVAAPTIAVTVSGNDSVDYLYEHIFFATTVTYEGSSPTYQWYENATAVTGATSATYDVWLASSDTVYCMVTSSLECVTSPTATSNTVIVKGDYLGIAEQHLPTANVRIYPNPSNGQFSIIAKNPLSEEGTIAIYNTAGIMVKEIPISTNTLQRIQIDTPPGTYQITLITPHTYWNGQITIVP